MAPSGPPHEVTSLAARVRDMSRPCLRMSRKSPNLARHVECPGHHAKIAICRVVSCVRVRVFCRAYYSPRGCTPAPPLLPSLLQRMSPITKPTAVRMPRRPRDHSLLISARVARGALLEESRARRYNASSSSSPLSNASTACAFIKTSRDPHDVRFDDTASSVVEQIAASWQGEHGAILPLCS